MEQRPAKRLVVYVGENQRWHHKPLWREVVDLCLKHGLAGTTATKGIVGFGHSGRVHEDLTPDVMPDLPVTIEAIDDAEKIDRALPDLDLVVQDGLIAVQDMQLIKARPRPTKGEAGRVPHQKLTGKAKMLRIHIGANDTWEGEALHLALVKRFHQLDHDDCAADRVDAVHDAVPPHVDLQKRILHRRPERARRRDGRHRIGDLLHRAVDLEAHLHRKPPQNDPEVDRVRHPSDRHPSDRLSVEVRTATEWWPPV